MHIENWNVDNEDNMCILVSYEKCLLNKLKACEKEAA